MNIFYREIKAHYKALIGWSIAMLFLVGSGMAKMSALSTGGQTANEIFKAFPKPVLVILGLQGFDLNTVSGYFGVLFLYIVLTAAIHAAMIGAEVISKEERDRTSEFLYPKPVSRKRVLTEKLSAAFLNVLILNLVTTFSSIFMVALTAKNYSNNNIIFVLMIGLFLIQLLFFTLGAFMASLLKNPKWPAAATTTILLSTYIIWVVVGLNANLDFLKYFSPFSYFDASILIKTGSLDIMYVTVSILLIIFMTIGSYYFYEKRDLTV